METIIIFIIFTSLMTSMICVSYDKYGRIEIHIGGIFPMSADTGGWAGGPACLPAALMALDDINNRRDVIPGYKLVLHGHKNDSMCQPGFAAKLMYDLIYNEPTKLMLLSGCSTETTIVAEAAEMWNLLVMGYGASSPALSDKTRFPTLFRTHPSATIHNPARLALFKKYNWKRIGVIHSNHEVFSTTADDLEDKLSEAHAVLVARANFGDPADAVANLKRQDARIIVGMYYEKDARRVLCEVYKKKLFGARYVWFLIGWYTDEWYLPVIGESIDCNADQMRQAAQYHFTTEGLMRSYDKVPGISKMTYDDFKERLVSLLDNFNTTMGTQEAPLAYDAIWAIALAFNCSIQKLAESHSGRRLEYFTYTDNETRRILDGCMKEVDFAGVSGQVKFSLIGDRVTLTQIEQLQGDHYVIVGNYDETKQEIYGTEPVIFPGGKPPQDETLVKEEWKAVSVDVYGSMGFFAGVGIAIAIACIGFNYGFSYRKLIYLSQYQINNLMVAGCIVCFVAIFVAGLPMETSPNHRNTFSLLCHARATLLMYGFTLVYGALFSKVWIVHRLGSVESRDQAVDGWKFYAIVGILAGIDTIIAFLWATVDPMHRAEIDLPDVEMIQADSTDTSVEDVKIDAKLEHCSSKYVQIWTWIIFAYKGLLLLFGLFLAYEIRNAKAKHVNDSRFVSMAIYNVAVLCLVTGPVTLIIPTEPDANFGFVACTILLCTFISMGLIFVPKVIHVIRVPNAADSHKASGGTGCSGSITDTTLTKEEQERLKKLIEENEDIQRQIAEKDMRILELRRRLEFRRAQHNMALVTGSDQESQQRSSISVSDQFPNGQLNKLALPTTAISSMADTTVVINKRSAVVAPCPQSITTLTTVHQQKITTVSGAGASVPTEPQPPIPVYEVDDSGYRSSINGRRTSYAVEPADTDVLL